MIFVGDIAIPYPEAIKVNHLPKKLHDEQWFGNLEGAIIKDANFGRNQRALFNGKAAIERLCSDFKYVGFALANNHILDIGDLVQTRLYLEEMGVAFCGIGVDDEDARRPAFLEENGKKILILNFGWEVIQCLVATSNRPGVNSFNRENVINTAKKIKAEHKDAIIIVYLHWSYEFEAEPQPQHRELAKLLIDIGLDGVIGCHSHRIGGFELYNGKPIVYSLGNWMISQNYYYNGNLIFPDFCNHEMAFDWDFNTNSFKFHFFSFDRVNGTLNFQCSESPDSNRILELTPFRNYSNEEYKIWYKANRFHKNKGLPIYYLEDTELVVYLKDSINLLRDFIIKFSAVPL